MNTTSTATLSVLVQDRPGVLTRVAGLFSRRGYNITALVVKPTTQPGTSQMTIVVDDSAPLDQVERQLDKLIDVLSIEHVSTTDTFDVTDIPAIDLTEWRATRPVPTPA